MDIRDPAAEYLRISEHYRRMTDEEIQVLIPQSSELTPFAQQALASEIRTRGLQAEASEAKVENKKPAERSPFRPPTYPVRTFIKHEPPRFRASSEADSHSSDSEGDADHHEEDPYEADRKLVELCTVWSVRDALKVQTILDRAGIPFFMGPEKATGVDEVTSDFSKGVGVQIMQIGLPWAGRAMLYYEPEDDPTPKEPENSDELLVRCPKCNSEEVVFEGGTSTLVVRTDDSSQKYRWSCDSCGYEWEDDGVAKEE